MFYKKNNSLGQGLKLTVPGDGPAETTRTLALLLNERRHLHFKSFIMRPLLVELGPLLIQLPFHLTLKAWIPQEFLC